MRSDDLSFRAPERQVRVAVVEEGDSLKAGYTACKIGRDIAFSTDRLQTYFFQKWDYVLYDMLLVAGAVEFCDMLVQRPAYAWSRHISVTVPIHETSRWNDPRVTGALHDALNFLTGDRWTFTFTKRRVAESVNQQSLLQLPNDVAAVIPFSEGLDSCSVAELKSRELKSALVRVRLGSKNFDMKVPSRRREPFANVPYSVRGPRRESSMRSRGFKFGIVSALGAYLSGARTVIIPESGQGSLGPALVPLGQVYPDYRTHPLFFRKLEHFLAAVLGQTVDYDLPRLWFTKGETLSEHLSGCTGDAQAWMKTWSCWQQNRHSSVSGKLRQCGICAACLLRRVSVHAAGQTEPSGSYVWEDLTAERFEDGASLNFDRSKITKSMRSYAIAGALHLDHLAGFRTSAANQKELELHAFRLASATGLPEYAVRRNVNRLLEKHEKEWAAFVDSLGSASFLRRWARAQ